jgi:hypothetical protein
MLDASLTLGFGDARNWYVICSEVREQRYSILLKALLRLTRGRFSPKEWW